MDLVKFIINIVTFAAGLACAGTLVEMTIAMKREAVKAHQTGIISLGKWNRELHSVQK